MIPFKQLSLVDFLPIVKINLITINMRFLNFSKMPLTLMKLSQCPLFLIFTLPPADLEASSFSGAQSLVITAYFLNSNDLS